MPSEAAGSLLPLLLSISPAPISKGRIFFPSQDVYNAVRRKGKKSCTRQPLQLLVQPLPFVSDLPSKIPRKMPLGFFLFFQSWAAKSVCVVAATNDSPPQKNSAATRAIFFLSIFSSVWNFLLAHLIVPRLQKCLLINFSLVACRRKRAGRRRKRGKTH